MQQCCVFGCRNIGNHSFPRDKRLRKQWEFATRCKNFVATKYSKICSKHFKPDDFRREGYQSGLKITKHILNRGAVPSIFTWSKKIDYKSIQQEEQTANLNVKKGISPKIKECAETPSISPSAFIRPNVINTTIDKILNSNSHDTDTLILIKTDSLLPVYYYDLLNSTLGNNFNLSSQDGSTLVLVQPGNMCELCNRNCGNV